MNEMWAKWTFVWMVGLGRPVWAEEPSASEGFEQAEHVRLSVEMERMAQRLAWKGVERKYQELLELGQPLTLSDHMHGAYASRELGDMSACYLRLKAAAEIEATKEIIDWLWDIDNNYGHVVLVTSPPRLAVLKAAVIPFDPNQRNAIESAVQSVREDGDYSGLLPLGEYVFAGQGFKIEPGITVRIEISPRMRRQGIVEPVIEYHEAPTIYMGDVEATQNVDANSK